MMLPKFGDDVDTLLIYVSFQNKRVIVTVGVKML